MKYRNMAAACAALALAVVPAQAMARDEGRSSAGLVLSGLQYEEDGYPSTSLGAAGVSFEYGLGRYFGIEGRVMVGISDRYVDSTATFLEFENSLGIYAKAYAPLSSALALYGLLGVTRGQVAAERHSVSVAVSASGTGPGPVSSGGGTYVETELSYGVGAEYEFGKTFALSLEWAHLFEGSDFKVEGVTTRLGWRF